MEDTVMEERQNFFVDYENSPQEQPVEQEVVANEQAVQEAVQEVEQPVQKKAEQQEPNAVRRLREEKQRLEREKSEMANRLKQLEESHKASQSSYDADDLVPRKYVDDQLKEIRQQAQRNADEYRLKSQYPDYDKVVNNATISILEEKNPALAKAIGQVYERDQYSAASAAYEAIKNMGIYTEDSFSQDRERAQLNAGKPRPTQSVSPAKGLSPIASANAFADDLSNESYRKKMWEETKLYMKNR